MPFGELSDEDLLALAKTRTGADRDALVNELFERHYDRVSRWCLRFTGDADRAADLAQDVFIKAHRHLSSFKGSSRFSTWLYSIVRNESLSRLKRQVPIMHSDEGLADLESPDDPPDELIDRALRFERLRELLAETLDPTERLVFTLHYGDEMPLAAITDLLKLANPSGAKAYIVSARRKLAKAAERLRTRGETL